MQEKSTGGALYFLCFKDEFSKYRSVLYENKVSSISECLKVFLNECKNNGNIVKELLCDGGKEFNNKDVKAELKSGGINFRAVIPYTYTPGQNGVAERENRILVESARSMIR